MSRALCSLVLSVLYIASVSINGQDVCVPAAVRNIVLYDEHILTWNRALTEVCIITHFLVYIQSESEQEEHLFSSNTTRLDVGHLPVCESVRFTVVPVSLDNVEGGRATIYTKTAAPPDVDLDLAFFRLSPYEAGVTLEWGIEDEWQKCVKEYRLVSYNVDDDDVFLTMYMFSPYATINNLIPCTSYMFMVTALYNLQTEGHVSVLRYVTPAARISPPTLQRVTLGSTNIELTLTLPGPTVNRCLVNALIVDSSPYFNISYPISGQNQVNRPPINVRVTSLQPDSLYVLRVGANNTAGLSAPLVIGVQTLE